LNGKSISKVLKQFLGEIPFTVELYWLLKQHKQTPKSHFQIKNLQLTLPEACSQIKPFAQKAKGGKKVFIFATLHYWIEHTTMLGLALAGRGHHVTLAYLPYAEWHKPISKFDLRRQNIYARQVLQEAAPFLKTVSFLDYHPFLPSLPQELSQAINQVSEYDTQYTLQTESFYPNDPTYRLRIERNQMAGQNAYNWLKGHCPDVVIVPNGTIQEFGVIYRVARYLNIPAVTYEFSDQREHIWLAQNKEIMRHETGELWKVSRDLPLKDEEKQRLGDLFSARTKATSFENFSRLWQGLPARGGNEARHELGLDERPVVLLATNVLGDSLTLGRHVFSDSMEEWISKTVKFFADQDNVQLVIRIHPGEALTHGASMQDVVRNALRKLPEHIHLIGPSDKVNTYDLVEVTDVGLVYTTTVGLEMAMQGIPVITSGLTHYRGRGFTLDPQTWNEYLDLLQKVLADPLAYRLSNEQMDLAWRYAYRFFFDFPFPFPWHIIRFWDDYKARPLKFVLGKEGADLYDATFKYLTGEPIDWAKLYAKS
jgi:hypothetical protein